jgi:hypothetical protein
MILASFLFIRETHTPTILRERAKHIRRTTHNPEYRTAGEKLETGRSLLWILQRSLTCPFRLLAFHPVIQIQACLSVFNYGILYLVLSTFSTLYTTQ